MYDVTMTIKDSQEMNVKCIDELTAFHLHDLSRLTPGVKVLIGHVGEIYSTKLSYRFKESARGELATITRTANISFNELYGINGAGESSKILQPVIFYQNGLGQENFIYANDAGVNVYDDGLYNKVNFIVVLSDLEQAGAELSLTPSEAYTASLAAYNSLVRAQELEDEHYER